MHWCAEETFMLLSMIPFIGVWFLKLKTWWHDKFHHDTVIGTVDVDKNMKDVSAFEVLKNPPRLVTTPLRKEECHSEHHPCEKTK